MFVSSVNGVSSAGGSGGGEQRTTKRSESGAGNWGPAEMEEMAILMASLMMMTVLVTFVLLSILLITFICFGVNMDTTSLMIWQVCIRELY